MSEEFQAFSSSPVLDSFQKRIEVLEAWEGKVIAGLADSTLVVLDPSRSEEAGPWQVVQALKAFSKKPLLQLQVAHYKC